MGLVIVLEHADACFFVNIISIIMIDSDLCYQTHTINPPKADKKTAERSHNNQPSLQSSVRRQAGRR